LVSSGAVKSVGQTAHGWLAHQPVLDAGNGGAPYFSRYSEYPSGGFRKYRRPALKDEAERGTSRAAWIRRRERVFLNRYGLGIALLVPLVRSDIGDPRLPR